MRHKQTLCRKVVGKIGKGGLGKVSHQPTLSRKMQFAEFNIGNTKDIF